MSTSIPRSACRGTAGRAATATRNGPSPAGTAGRGAARRPRPQPPKAHSGAGGGSKAALNITKSAAVDGGTADHAGEVITYSMTLANTGNVNLTGITVSDPSVFDLTRGLDQVGNNDNVLNVGEIWTYTAHHVVTQDEIDEAASVGG